MESKQQIDSTQEHAQSAGSQYTADYEKFLDFYFRVSEPHHVAKQVKVRFQKQLPLETLLRRLLEPGKDIGKWVQLINKLVQEEGVDGSIELIVGKNEAYPRFLYNRLRPFNPVYYARDRAIATSRLVPLQALGVYSVEGSNRLMSAVQALGQSNVIPRTKEQVNNLALAKNMHLRKVKPFKMVAMATDRKSILPFFESTIKNQLTIANEQPMRQDVSKMPYNHFIEMRGQPFTFSYDVEAINPPVFRYGLSQVPVEYVPTYFVAGPDPVLKKVIDNKYYYWLAENKWADMGEPGAIYLDALQRYVYTSGSPPGQVAYIKRVKDARFLVQKEDRMKYQLTFTDVNPIGLEKQGALKFDKPRVPGLKEFASLPDMVGFFDSQFKFDGDKSFSSVNVNMNSSTGIWSGRGNKKNSEVNFQTLFCLAEDAMRIHEKTGGVPAAFFTGIIKNKAEVYDREEVNSKTRNIIAFNFPATVILQMVQFPIFKNRRVVPEEFLKFQTGELGLHNYNVMGYSPTHSFYNKMVEQMRQAHEGAQLMLFMSDNLWIADKRDGEVRWLSLDGTKMESSHGAPDVASYLKFVKGQYEWDPDTWKFFELSVKKMMVGAEALLGRTTYYMEQLTSGFPETGGVNCIKMARCVKYLILLYNHVNYGTDGEETQAVVEHYRSLSKGQDLPKGRTLYELWLTGDLTPAFTSEGVTMKEALHNPTVLETLQNGVSPLDFLGFDITMQGDSFDDPELGIVFPVLEKSRIVKGMVFNKTTQKLKDLNDDDKRLAQAAVGLSKTTSLMLAGGWAHEELRHDLQAMFYNYQAFGQMVNKSVLAETIAQDLHELGFRGEMLNLGETIPNMDTIARIFLDPEDYYRVRQVLDKFVAAGPDQFSESTDPDLILDFYSPKAQDKSFIVSMIPMGDPFEFIDAGDFSRNPVKPQPEDMDHLALEIAMTGALAKVTRHGNVNFTMSESFYLRSLEAAVTGIKQAIIKDLRHIADILFPKDPPTVEQMVDHIYMEYGSKRGASLVAKLKDFKEHTLMYEQKYEAFQQMYDKGHNRFDYRYVLRNHSLKLDDTDAFASLSEETREKIRRAQDVEKAATLRDLTYTYMTAQMREEILFVVRMHIRSEVFQVLLRRVIEMPSTIEGWNATHMGDMFAIHVNQLTAYDMTKEAYSQDPCKMSVAARPGGASLKCIKSAPFSLALITVQTSQGKQDLWVPMNSSIKRSAASECLAQIANIPGSTRRTDAFKAVARALYLGMSKSFAYQYYIKTNKASRLAAITYPVTQFPARKIVNDLRHVSAVQSNITGMYHSYVSILFESFIIDKMPPEMEPDEMTATVAIIQKTLQAKDIGVTEVLTYVKQALFNTAGSSSATMVALLKALPTVRTQTGEAGFRQLVLNPSRIKASTIAIGKLIGSDDLRDICYLMTQVQCTDQTKKNTLDLKGDIELWAARPRDGTAFSTQKIQKSFSAIWKAPKHDKVKALCQFLLDAHSVFHVVGSKPNATEFLNIQFAPNNPYRYYVEMLGFPEVPGSLPGNVFTEDRASSERWSDIVQKRMLVRVERLPPVEKFREVVYEAVHYINSEFTLSMDM